MPRRMASSSSWLCRDDFDRERVVKIAAGARDMFQGMPGLRSKAFTVDEAKGTLGAAVKLPPWLEARRTEIVAALPPLA